MSDLRLALEEALHLAAHRLPDQGPIGVFVHHNTLHSVQDRPFHEAVVEGASWYGARPYLEEGAFRAAWRAGRIEDQDVDAALPPDGPILGLRLSARGVRRALLAEELESVDEAGRAYQERAGRLRPDPLRAAAEARLAGRAPRPRPAPAPRRHRDALVALGAEDTDAPLHAELQRWCASFLDQGQALAPMPGRERGLLEAVASLCRDGAPGPRFAPGAAADLAALPADSDPLEACLGAMDALGVTAEAAPDWLAAALFALPGWAGMMSRLERHPEDVDPHHRPIRVRLADFLALRLLLERRAVERAARRAGLPCAWEGLRAAATPRDGGSRAADATLLAGLARAGGASPEEVASLEEGALEALFAEVAAFPTLARRRAFQEAYERRYHRSILGAIAAHRRDPRTRRRLGGRAARPAAQVVLCIDEREEAFRRAVEEQGERFETLATAGFFGVAIDYQGIDDHHPAAHAPVVVTPAHEVHEAPVYTDRALLASREGWRHWWRRLQQRVHLATRQPLAGALHTLLFGPAAGLGVASHVVAPRRTLAVRAEVARRLAPRPKTRLRSVRSGQEERSDRGKWLGFSLEEKVDRVASVLQNLGLTSGFAPLVVVLGHGSTSLNNPHESAHDCGACGGRRGGANARLFAEMANRPEVREGLRARGIAVPSDTWFVGGLHDTSDDAVRLEDLDRLPPDASAAFDELWAVLERARRQSAQERARRFHDAPLDVGPDEALRHVEERASHLAQPRPEYGHCTNAVAVVGRRALTRDLFLDRRSFLVSYDPTEDPQGVVLERLLAAVGPVGAGINLEYYFSSVDVERFGCGTKLPHNVTGLIGVMNGHRSDLRTGLPLQMVELHEPMRLLLVVESTPERLLAIAGRQAEVRQLVVNGWVRLVSVDPDSGAMHRFDDAAGAFVPWTPEPVTLPRVGASREWFQRSRDHLPPAAIDPPGSGAS